MKETAFPFKILGTADDGNAYFLDRNDRLFITRLENLTQTKLLKLAQFDWWQSNYAEKSKMSSTDWQTAYDDIIHIAGELDFDPDNIRGRGAWKDGRDIIYHDGKETIGNKTDKYLYVRSSKEDIGIDSTPANNELCREITDIVSEMTFETKTDAFRILGWAVLAPFSGALPWRPAILVTGPSGSGKSTIGDIIAKNISLPKCASGGETSTAGIRGKVWNDSCGVLLEESEDDNPKKKILREEQFSLMRQSTSDDAPDVWKGTKDGGFVSYKMRSMFLFISISPQIESVADENRIFKINMRTPTTEEESKWPEIESRLSSLLTKENCDSIRAKTWKLLPEILEFAKKITPIVQKVSKRSRRVAFADAMLLSAYTKVWAGKKNMTEQGIEESLKKIYEWQPASEQRDETQEIIDRIMDEIIEVEHDVKREKITIGEALIRVRENDGENMSVDAKSNHNALKRYGLAYIKKHDSIAIQNNHSKIKRIIGKGTGYGEILKRHKDLHKKNYVVTMHGKSRTCTLIKWCLEDGDE